MAIQEAQADRRLTLMRDANEVRKDLALPLKTGNASPVVNPLKQPVRIALYKPWTANMDEGWTRFVFDTYNVPFTSVNNSDLREHDLSAKYNVFILPSQRAREIIDGDPTQRPSSGICRWDK